LGYGCNPLLLHCLFTDLLVFSFCWSIPLLSSWCKIIKTVQAKAFVDENAGNQALFSGSFLLIPGSYDNSIKSMNSPGGDNVRSG
jgi:hypothetical protein